jgi:iron complex transport system substrate-binding protein
MTFIAFSRLCRTVLTALALVSALPAHATTTLTDIAGRTVNLPDKVNRVLLGEGRLFYAMALLEGKKPFDRLVGWQGDFRMLDPQTYGQYHKHFPEIDNIPLIGKSSESTVSAEKVLSLRPDVAIFSISGHGPNLNNPIVKQLASANIPVVFVDFRSAPLENSIPSMRILGKALQREKEAERFIRFYEDNLKKVTDVVKRIPDNKRPLAFLELRADAMEYIASAGKGSVGEFVEFAGAHNLASRLLRDTIGEVNMEQVLALKPSLYIATGTGLPDAANGVKMGNLVTADAARASLSKVAVRDQLKGLPAAKNPATRYAAWHHFYVTPYHVALIQAMAKWFHPQEFAKLDPEQTWKELYDQFLAIPADGTFWVSGQ